MSLFVLVRQAELGEIKKSAIPRQQPDDRRFPVLRRHGGDANIDFRSGDAQTGGAILRQPPLGDIQSGQNLDSRDQGLRQYAGRRRDRAQQTVDAHAHGDAVAERLDMDVAGAQFHRLLEQIVDGAHGGRAARKIAQILDVVVAVRRADFGNLGQCEFVVAEPRRQNGENVLIRGNRNGDMTAEHDFRRLDRRRVGWIGNGKLETPVRRFIGKHRHLAQEPAREPPDERRCRHQLRQARARQAEKPRDFVGEVIRRQIGQFT